MVDITLELGLGDPQFTDIQVPLNYPDRMILELSALVNSNPWTTAYEGETLTVDKPDGTKMDVEIVKHLSDDMYVDVKVLRVY